MPDSSNFQDYDVHNSDRALIMMQVDNETVLAGISMLLWKIPGLKAGWEESICLDYRLKSFTEGSQDRRLETGTRRQELKYRPCRTPLTGLLSLFFLCSTGPPAVGQHCPKWALICQWQTKQTIQHHRHSQGLIWWTQHLSYILSSNVQHTVQIRNMLNQWAIACFYFWFAQISSLFHIF